MAEGKGPTPKTHRLKMAVISEADSASRAVLDGTDVPKGDPIMRDSTGTKSPILECGNCAYALLVGVPTSAVQDLVFKCPDCGAFNETIE